MPDRLPARAAIALGSNLGDRDRTLNAAIAAIAALGSVVAVSHFVDTTPVGYLDQPRFLNGALLLDTALSPFELLTGLLAIEQTMGRDRAAVPAKGPRSIDLDLIFYNDLVLHTPTLILPHPAMHQRAFVLAPLAQIAPGWIHPLLAESVAALLEKLGS